MSEFKRIYLKKPNNWSSIIFSYSLPTPKPFATMLFLLIHSEITQTIFMNKIRLPMTRKSSISRVYKFPSSHFTQYSSATLPLRIPVWNVSRYLDQFYVGARLSKATYRRANYPNHRLLCLSAGPNIGFLFGVILYSIFCANLPNKNNSIQLVVRLKTTCRSTDNARI